MFKKLVPLNRDRHANFKVKPLNTFDFAKNFHIASLMVHEFARAASVYSIVFLEDQDKFRPVVMLGLDAGENLFVGENGLWKASYVPAIIRRYPFALAKGETQDVFAVCIDEESPFVNTEEGLPLFDDKGEPTAVVDNVKKYLTEMQQMDNFTAEFCTFLAEHNLFTPLSMNVRYGEGVRNITGSYVINEERLNKLSDELFLEMRKKHYFAPIYAHLTSLSQLERLSSFKEGEHTLAPQDTLDAQMTSEDVDTSDKILH